MGVVENEKNVLMGGTFSTVFPQTRKTPSAWRTLWLMMVPYPLRFARIDSDGLFAAYT